jgi:hypothetical protein
MMNCKFKIALILAGLALILSGMTAFARGAERSTVDVSEIATGEVVGESTLVRNDNGIQMRFRVNANEIEGLEPGDVATIWWVIFNNPDVCTVPGECSSVEFTNPEVDASAFYAAGSVIGGSGTADFAASLPKGRTNIDLAHEANQLLFGDAILKNPRNAEVHLVLRTHGPKIPHLVNQMLKTHDAGCESALDDGRDTGHPLKGTPDLPHLAGPNTCMNLAAAIHR